MADVQIAKSSLTIRDGVVLVNEQHLYMISTKQSRVSTLRQSALFANQDISALQNLQVLTDLDCSSNRITQIPDCTWPFLVRIDLNNNRIARIPKMNHPMLQVMYLNNNEISSLVDDEGNYLLDEANLPKLNTIELCHNKFETKVPTLNTPLHGKEAKNYEKFLRKIGFFHSNLKMLDLTDNKITSLAAIYKPPEDVPEDDNITLKVNPFGCRLGMTPSLVVLHLQNNGLTSLHGFTKEAFGSLRYLNLRDNKIAKFVDIKQLADLNTLDHVIFEANPIEEAKNYRPRVLQLNMHIRCLDKEEVSEEDLEEANRLIKERAEKVARNERAADEKLKKRRILSSD